MIGNWLNTPLPPREASGTSGMKAAINAVPSLSILDGWWIEGCIEGTTGWAIASAPSTEADQTSHDAVALYDKLERVILPLFYKNRAGFPDVMRHVVALNGSFFHDPAHGVAVRLESLLRMTEARPDADIARIHRDERMELQELGQRRILSARFETSPMAWLLLGAVRYRRSQQHVLPLAGEARVREVAA